MAAIRTVARLGAITVAHYGRPNGQGGQAYPTARDEALWSGSLWSEILKILERSEVVDSSASFVQRNRHQFRWLVDSANRQATGRAFNLCAQREQKANVNKWNKVKYSFWLKIPLSRRCTLTNTVTADSQPPEEADRSSRAATFAVCKKRENRKKLG